MKWFSRLFERKPREAVKEEAVISFEEFSLMIGKDIDNKLKEFWPDLENFYSQMQSSVDKLQEKLDILSKAVPQEQVDFQLLKVASSNRTEMVRKLNSMAKEFRRQMPANLDDFVEFHNFCVSSMNTADAKLARSFSIFEPVFREESSRLMSDYRGLYKLLEYIGVYLKEKKLAMNPLYEARNHADSIKNTLSGIKTSEIAAGNLKVELEALASKRDSLNEEITNLLSGKEWNLFQSVLKDRVMVAEAIKEAEGEISQTVISIERALKKYGKLPNAHGKKLAEFYLKDPVSASLSDKNQTGMNEIINSVENAIIEGKMEIDDKKKERLLDHIEEIKGGSLGSLVEKYESLQGKKQELDVVLESIDVGNVKRSLEMDLKSVDGSISEMEARIRKFESSKAAMSGQLDSMGVSLGKMVQAMLNRNVKINIPV